MTNCPGSAAGDRLGGGRDAAAADADDHIDRLARRPASPDAARRFRRPARRRLARDAFDLEFDAGCRKARLDPSPILALVKPGAGRSRGPAARTAGTRPAARRSRPARQRSPAASGVETYSKPSIGRYRRASGAAGNSPSYRRRLSARHPVCRGRRASGVVGRSLCAFAAALVPIGLDRMKRVGSSTELQRRRSGGCPLPNRNSRGWRGSHSDELGQVLRLDDEC